MVLFPDSSAVEQLTVNQLVRGSIPRRGARFSVSSVVSKKIDSNFSKKLKDSFNKYLIALFFKKNSVLEG